MGWDWQWCWWHHHREMLEAELVLLACYAGETLVGLAPFYRHAAAHRAGIRATRLAIIGSTFRDGRGVFSEYLDVIADRAHVPAVQAAIGRALLEDRHWSDLVIGNAPVDGVGAGIIRHHLASACSVRETDHLEAHRAELPGGFEAYLRSLDGSTRRKVWNQRSKLTDPSLEVASAGAVSTTLDRIDTFHLDRWGKPQYVGVARNFHEDLAARLAARGALRMSTLRSAGKPIAVMYNVRLGGTEYNLQSGFETGEAAGKSPGYLHFGFSIEEACRDGIRYFDFLGGEGRRRQYKQDFVTTARPLATYQAVRSLPLRGLYRLHGMLVGSKGRP